VAYLIVPIFAFSNAGVSLGGDLGAALTSNISLGIVAGLLLGKPIGITFFSWIAVKLGIADLPYGVSWRQLFAASWLAGIGFTMSLFIADSAFAGDLLDTAKMSILIASLLAGAVGFGLLMWASSTHEEASQLEEAPAAASAESV
jgi:NhaA family Na+:H+ antiporter